jgi:hypothetical protein
MLKPLQSRTVVISTSMVAWLIIGTCVSAQTVNSNTVAFHERKGVHPISEPPAPLRQITAELSGSLVGQPPNLAIEFVLTLQNTGHQEVKIANPLDSLFLRFATSENKLITVPARLPKAVLNIKSEKENIPFPAAIELRQIVQGNSVRYQKEEVITIAPGEKIQIVFDTQPVIMEKVNAALESEAGRSGRSFKAKAGLVLLNAPPQAGGRSVESDWAFFSL